MADPTELSAAAYDTFAASVKRSEQLDADIKKDPSSHRVMTGDRPTGDLHIGHLLGSLQNRVRIANLGVETFILIADYQVLTDHDVANQIYERTLGLMLDYMSVGLDPYAPHTYIYAHSCVPELNQLILPFLTLVSVAELERNPTVKEEIEAAKITRINAGMLTYPVHQAADILFCKADVVPVGKDQLPHLEISRQIARRFNTKYSPQRPIFPEPHGLLSSSPNIPGLDGGKNKMSKSRGNAIILKSTEDETAKVIKSAVTDSERHITYEPERRPEVANLLNLAHHVTGIPQQKIAEEIGDGGAGKLKAYLTDSVNAFLKPIREKRRQLEQDIEYVRKGLDRGNLEARARGEKTLLEVREAMNMYR